MTTDKILVYDLKIALAIPPENAADRIPELEYCNGWDDFANMGISCVAWVLLDAKLLQTQELYCSHWAGNIAEAFHVISRDSNCIIGGFNSRKFNDRLLQANDVSIDSSFDILELVLTAAEMKDVRYWEKGYKYNLAAIAAANGMAKTGEGQNAPILYQTGMYTKLLNYCLTDAIVQAEILTKLLKGKLIDPNTGELLYIDPEYLI
jgi:hypothetical protein